jgi:hypothetical protein
MTMGQETLEPVETNDIGKVKIASSTKTRKWVWVNAKQYRGILKRRLARLKWKKTRKKRSQRENTWVLRKKQHPNKSSLQVCGNKYKGKGKVIDDYALYSPTSTPLTWSFDLYVKELLKVKERLEVVEAKELERDCTIHRIIAENQDLAENNKVLKEQVSLLQEALQMGKTEWQRMKAEVKNMKKIVVENTEVMNAKPSQDKGKVVTQIDNNEETSREERKGDSTKLSKTWAQIISNPTRREGERNIQVGNMQDRESKERHDRATNIIIKGVKDYGKNECTLDLARDFLKDKLQWQGQICQAWRVGKPNGERARPIKFIMPNLCDKDIILSKKQFLRGSRFFLEEDLTVRQQEERRDEMTKVREARDEGKRAWIYKGKVVIAQFGPPSKTRQQDNNKEEATNSSARNEEARSVWASREKHSTVSLACQNK